MKAPLRTIRGARCREGQRRLLPHHVAHQRRVGLRLVDPGNIVHSTDTNGMLVITQIQPISVIFTVSEDQLPPILQKLRAGQKLPVDAWDRELKNKLAIGHARHDRQRDRSDHRDPEAPRRFRQREPHPLSQSVCERPSAAAGKNRRRTLLPSAAIQRNTNDTYVYLIKPDNTVTVRNIKVGTTEGDQSEITSGLAAGRQSGDDRRRQAAGRQQGERRRSECEHRRHKM